MTRNQGQGFTIVELMVTVVVLLVLITIVVVRLAATQASGRDQEREIDTAAIATGLEVYYQDGDDDAAIPKGYYPGATQILAAAGGSPPFGDLLEGVPEASFIAPERIVTTSFGVDPNYATAPAGANPDGSYDETQALALLTTYPYLYQPLRRDNTFCANYLDCVRFNLYYLEEETGDVITIRSKNQ